MFVRDYSEEDKEAAKQLELLCIQGKKTKISFYREDFAARSRSYENYYIICGLDGEKLIALGAGALKNVKTRGKYAKAGYIYDLRTHPDYRKKGIATKMIAILEDKLKEAEFFYSFVISDNEAALKSFKKSGYADINQFSLLVIPAFRRRKTSDSATEISLNEAKRMVKAKYSDLDFFCEPENLEDAMGYVSSYEISNTAFCSIWSNEKIMREKVCDVPLSLKILGKLMGFASSFFAVPYVPKKEELIRSWIVFDFYAENSRLAEELFSGLNNFALENRIHYLMFPMQPADRHFRRFNKDSFTDLQFRIMQKNARITGDVYLDVRDL